VFADWPPNPAPNERRDEADPPPYDRRRDWLVFAHGDGTPLHGDDVTKRFSDLCDAAGVRRVRQHDLRHGTASLRLAAGADIVPGVEAARRLVNRHHRRHVLAPAVRGRPRRGGAGARQSRGLPNGLPNGLPSLASDRRAGLG
jgi:hypothetical protein